MASYGTYLAWNIIVPAVISFLLWLVFLAVVLFYSFRKDRLPRIFVGMLQLSLPNIEDDQNGACVKVFGRNIRRNALKVLTCAIIPLTIATIFFSFWNVWLVEEEARGPCLPHFDCFKNRELGETAVDICPQSSHILNGTETPEGKDVTYVCYRFAFNYAEGIGAAGGILIFTAIFSTIYFALLVGTFGKGGVCCMAIGGVGIVVAVVLWVVFIVVNAVFHETVFQTTTDIIQFVLYALNFGAIVIFGTVIAWGVVYT